MPSIGSYAPPVDYSSVPDDIYEATIASASIVMEKDQPTVPLIDKFGKSRVLVKFTLDNETGNDGGSVELRRQFAISYGATGGTYAALAQLIQAATGIKCGDKAQRNVTTEQLQGARLRVQTATVEKDDKTYTNVVATFPPKAQGARPAAQTKAAASLGLADDDLDEIPF